MRQETFCTRCAVLNPYIHCIEDSILDIFGDFATFGGRYQDVFFLIFKEGTAFQCVWRGLAGYHSIQDGPKGIDIGMRSLVSSAAILLFWGVSGLYDNSETAAVRSCGIAGGTKVDELNLTIFGNHDIVWSNIAMDDTCFMYRLKRANHWGHQLNCFFNWDLPFPIEESRQSFTVQILHNNIGGVVGLKAVVDPDDTIFTLELGQTLCFIDKFGHAVCKLLSLIASKDRDISLPH